MPSARYMMIAGIVLAVGGALALLAPLAASVAVTLFVGWGFLLSGIFNAVSLFTDAEHRGDHAVFGALGLFIGIAILVDPLGGLVSLTILLGVLFLISGAVRLWLAWAGRGSSFFWVLLMSGALSVMLGALILSSLDGAGQAALGLVLGIEMLSVGIGLVTLSRMRGG